MSINYVHLFVVADTSWRPTRQRAEAIHRELHRWGLVGMSSPAGRGLGETRPRGKPSLFAVQRGKVQPIGGRAIARGGRLPAELALLYDGTDDDQACVRVFGEQALFCSVEVWLGHAPKVVECGYEGLRVRITKPPRGRDGATRRELELCSPMYVRRMFEWRDGDRDLECELRCLDQLTGATDRAPPPGYPGWFRSGVIVDCDRAIPRFADALAADRVEWGVPNRDFVRALSDAFEAPLAELGVFY